MYNPQLMSHPLCLEIGIRPSCRDQEDTEVDRILLWISAAWPIHHRNSCELTQLWAAVKYNEAQAARVSTTTLQQRPCIHRPVSIICCGHHICWRLVVGPILRQGSSERWGKEQCWVFTVRGLLHVQTHVSMLQRSQTKDVNRNPAW